MTLDIDKLEKAALAANKYEWRAEMHHETNYARIYMFPDSKDSLAGYCGCDNATHVATANPSAVLELINRLRAAEKCLFQMQNAAIDLGKKLEAAEKDAERYRWLKSTGKVVSIDYFKGHYRAVDVSVNLIMTDWLPSFDEAVDASMEAMKEKP